jgi:dGTPase
LVVPREQRMEVAVLKAIANLWVMQRAGAEPIYLKQREIIQDLVKTLLMNSTRDLDPVFYGFYVDAPDDAIRLRVVIDQVAGLTDRSVLTWINRSDG